MMPNPGCYLEWEGTRIEERDGTRLFAQRWSVIVRNQGDDPLAMTGLPVKGTAAKPPHAQLRVRDRLVVQRKGPMLYLVEVVYAPPEESKTTKAGKPDDRRPLRQVRWDDGVEMEEATEDVNGNPIVNSALEPFPRDKPRRRVHTQVLSVTQWEGEYNSGLARAFIDHVNERPFYGREPGEFLCTSIKPETAYDPYSVQRAGLYMVYSFLWKPNRSTKDRDAHFERMLDEGSRHLLYENTQEFANKYHGSVPKIENVDGDGNPTREPQLLDGHGRLLAAPQGERNEAPKGAVVVEAKTRTAVYLEYQVYPFADFIELNLESAGGQK